MFYQSIKLTFWSSKIHQTITQLLRARLPGNKQGAWCDGVVYLKEQGRALGIGRVRHFIKYKAQATHSSPPLTGEGVVLEVMPMVTSCDKVTGLPIVQEPGLTRSDVLLAPPGSILFGVHLCPVFSSMTPAGRRALVQERRSASDFAGSSSRFTQWFVNTYAEEHVGLLFADEDFRALFQP